MTRRGFMAGLAALPVAGRLFGECPACEQGPQQEYTIDIQGVPSDDWDEHKRILGDYFHWHGDIVKAMDEHGVWRPGREAATRFQAFAARVALSGRRFPRLVSRLKNGGSVIFENQGGLVVGVFNSPTAGVAPDRGWEASWEEARA